jgi:serine/threonine protein kinase
VEQRAAAAMESTEKPPSKTKVNKRDEQITWLYLLGAPEQPPREFRSFKLSGFNIKRTIAMGSFGRVKLAQNKDGGELVALKVMRKSEIVRMNDIAHVENELSSVKAVYHPFITNFLGHFQDELDLYFASSYCAGGELYSILIRDVRFSERTTRFYAAEVLLALSYLHETGLLHRNLQPEVILLSDKGHVKLCGFGSSKFSAEERTFTTCGSPEYQAPEMFLGQGYTKSADWWAYGVLLYELLIGNTPFVHEHSFGVYKRILGGVVEFPKHRHISKFGQDLLSQLLRAKVGARLGCTAGGPEEVKLHKWFGMGSPQKILDWQAVYDRKFLPPHVPELKNPADARYFDIHPEQEGEMRVPLTQNDRQQFECFGPIAV